MWPAHAYKNPAECYVPKEWKKYNFILHIKERFKLKENIIRHSFSFITVRRITEGQLSTMYEEIHFSSESQC